jgi:hypothetical protein
MKVEAPEFTPEQKSRFEKITGDLIVQGVSPVTAEEVASDQVRGLWDDVAHL